MPHLMVHLKVHLLVQLRTPLRFLSEGAIRDLYKDPQEGAF